jgi:hypothetical protein
MKSVLGATLELNGDEPIGKLTQSVMAEKYGALLETINKSPGDLEAISEAAARVARVCLDIYRKVVTQ